MANNDNDWQYYGEGTSGMVSVWGFGEGPFGKR